jgi:formylglycine-generating enzyme
MSAMLRSNGRKTVLYVLLTTCVALFFFTCSVSNPLTGDQTKSLVLRLEVTDSLLQAEMMVVDSIHLRFSCIELPEPMSYSFLYSAHKGDISGVPAKSTDVEINLKWNDKAGTIIYSRDFFFNSLNTDTLVLLISGDSMPPRAPSDLAATAVSVHSVRLTWKNNSRFAKNFVVERCITGTSNYTIIGTTSIVCFTDSMVFPSASYRYRLFAVNDAGSSQKIECGPVFIPDGDTTPPCIRVLSNSNPDTVGSAQISFIGIAMDESGIAELTVNNQTLTMSGTVWQTGPYSLLPGVNHFKFRATDNSPLKNSFSVDLVIYYDNNHTDTSTHPPRFVIRSGNLAAVLRPGDQYRKVLAAEDRIDFKNLHYLVSLPITFLDDTTIVWKPAVKDTGTHQMWAKVFDPSGSSDSLKWSIIVVDIKTNAPPAFTTVSEDLADSVLVGNTYNETLIAYDLDTNSILRYSFSLGSRKILTDDSSNHINFVAVPGDLGPKLATATVRDDSGACAVLSYVVTVYDTILPVANAGHDTLVSINDTVRLHGTATRKNDGIARLEWDIGGTGTFVRVSTGDTTIRMPSKAGTCRCVFSVTDYAGHKVTDEMQIEVFLDPPVVEAGPDLAVAVNEPFQLQGSASDGFGRIVKWEWKIGEQGQWMNTGSPVYISTGSLAKGHYICSFRVTDDDSNAVVDEMALFVGAKNLRYISPDTGDRISFAMGWATGEIDEQPVHQVALSPFFVDSTEVSQEEYMFLMKTNPSFARNPSYPAECVTWFDAVLFCNARSKFDGFDTVYSYSAIVGKYGNQCADLVNLKINIDVVGYRLPTEAEWEYMCDGGASEAYWWGTDSLQAGTYAWFAGNSSAMVQVIANKKPNKFGIYDAAGNVWEWCNDWYQQDYYEQCDSQGTSIDPSGPAGGIARVIRGGSWRDNACELRTSNRGIGIPSWSSTFVGFRCVLPAKK